jgi:hypothetical protein
MHNLIPNNRIILSGEPLRRTAIFVVERTDEMYQKTREGVRKYPPGAKAADFENNPKKAEKRKTSVLCGI